jgi:outer membrane protein OmpA-like peptidoglycan-associated protein
MNNRGRAANLINRSSAIEHISLLLLSLFICGLSNIVFAQRPQEDRSLSLKTLTTTYTQNGFLGVPSAELPQSRWGASVMSGWSQNLVQPFYQGLALDYLVDDRVESHLNTWVQVSDWALLGVDMPFLMTQTRSRIHPLYGELEPLDQWALGDLTLGLRAPIIRGASVTSTAPSSALALQVNLLLPTSQSADYFEDAFGLYDLALLWSYRNRGRQINTSAGYIHRGESLYLGAPISDELYVKVAGRYQHTASSLWSLEGSSELKGETSLDGFFNTQTELLFNAGVSFKVGPTRFSLFGSRAAFRGVTTPSWRAGLVVHWQSTKIIPPPPPPPEKVIEYVNIVQRTPPKDLDLDSILDTHDRCPALAGPVALEGCPEDDFDGDTVSNLDDWCPWARGVPSNQGCVEGEATIPDRLRAPLLFKRRVSTLSTKMRSTLQLAVSFLKRHPSIRLNISGHADYRGNNNYNLYLSNKRIKSVVSYLVKLGLSRDRVASESVYGETIPLVYQIEMRDRQINRRVVLTFIR